MNIFPKHWRCSWFHGGGTIKRDEQDRINWQCNKCKRWSDYPVELKQEAKYVTADINNWLNFRDKND